MLVRAILVSVTVIAACGRPTDHARPAIDEPGAAAEFKSAWSESPPCYVPDPDAGPSRFDKSDGQFVLRPCPPDAGMSDADASDASAR